MNFPQFPRDPRLPSFDNFGKTQKRATSLIGIAFGAWCIYALLCLGVVGAVIYVAIHFLAKVW